MTPSHLPLSYTPPTPFTSTNFIIIPLKIYIMIQEDTNDLFKNLSENDPKQLKQVIETLIGKSRVLIQNLEETWQKLEQT